VGRNLIVKKKKEKIRLDPIFRHRRFFFLVEIQRNPIFVDMRITKKNESIDSIVKFRTDQTSKDKEEEEEEEKWRLTPRFQLQVQ